MHYQRVIDWIDDRIATRPGSVVLVFLLLTGVFVAGLGDIEQQTGTDQFTEDLESQQALDDINREFGGSFGTATASTTLLQDSGNVLSKPALVRMLRVQHRLSTHDELHVTGTHSAASAVATRLEPDATTTAEKLRAMERATPSEIDAAVRQAAADDAFGTTVSDDFNAESATAGAAKTTVTHGVDDVSNRQSRVETVVGTVPGDIRVQGDWPNSINDSLALTLPAALLLIVGFLIVAYRDPIDMVLGIVALVMTLVWTFGFIGLAGIPFSAFLISVPPLLIAVGVDFGIHAVNRYREERTSGQGIVPSMRTTTDQLLVAFFIVAGTTVIGFLSNQVSALGPVRDFGLVAAAGIVFTLFIFGVFLPAAKVLVDRRREDSWIPDFSRQPLGSEGSMLGRVLSVGTAIAGRAPGIFLALCLVSTAAAGVYATGVDSGFETDDQLPPAETPEALQSLPEPFAPPASYPYVEKRNFRQRHFSDDGAVILHVRGQLDHDHALERLHDAGRDPPSTYLREDGYAESRSIITVIQSRAEADPDFRRLVERNDANDNDIPDDNLGRIYDALLSSPARDRALQYLNPDRRTAKVVYLVEESAPKATVTTQTRDLTAEYPYEASATGRKLIFQDIVDLLMGTVLQSLAITLAGTAVFLVLAYWATDGAPSLGVANIVPISMTVVALVASMRALGVAFNVFNGMIVSLTIGLGIDYSVHFTHRFVDELGTESVADALSATARNTGGALTGSLLTTASGVGVLVLAVNPLIGTFGLLTGLSILYSYLSTMLVLPSVLVVWHRLANWAPALSQSNSKGTVVDGD